VSKRMQCCAAVAIAMLVAGANQALAQAWPAKPVRVVVPLSAGGGVDTVARVFAAKFSEAWNQPVVVDNRPGAGGTIGADLVAKAPKDGYTLLISASSHAVSASLYPNLPYDALKDFAPATQIISTYLMLAVNPKVPATSVKELVALAKSQPGKLNFGSTGSGSAPHLVSELFRLEAGIDVVHVPYKGDRPLQPALLGNDVQYAFLTPIAVMQHVKTGRLRAVAVTGTQRASIAPDVPTIAEAGLPNAGYVGWMGIFAPGGTPRDVLEKIAGETARILKMPDIASKVPGWGGEAAGTRPEEFTARFRSDVAKFARIIKEARVPQVK